MPSHGSWVTRNAALKDATVCLDLNGNDACDAGEPASAATGVNGQYSLTALPAQVAGVRLIAIVKANQYFEKPLSKRERRLKAIVRTERRALKVKRTKLGQR